MALTNEDLQAIAALLDTTIDQKLEPVTERLDKMDERFDRMDERLDKMDERFDRMDERLDRMDERLDKMDERFDRMDTRFDKLETLVTKNYDKTLEFYASQQEFNNELKGMFKVITGELEMHNEQIARNTADIKSMKTA